MEKTSIRSKFVKDPSKFYAMSIAATWAGSGSFYVGIGTAQEQGIIPVLLWALGNTLACIVFGIVVGKWPSLRKVFMSKAMKVVMGVMCVFQIWINMQGINQSLAPTVLGQTVATVITYAISFAFLILYLKDALVRNVLTDNGSWSIVYMLVAILAIVSIAANGLHPIPIGSEPAAVTDGVVKLLKLLPGCFLYPAFWEMFLYNEENEDGTKSVDMTKCFIAGGLLFGFYLLFILLMAFTTFSSGTELVKGVLISLVAISSLSSFIYGAMIDFGKKLGFAIAGVAIATWSLMMPLGVAGIWSAMATARIVLVVVAIAVTAIVGRLNAKKQEA